MQSRAQKPTLLAQRIVTHLLTESRAPSDFNCLSTGHLIRGSCDYKRVCAINVNAIGAHYLAFGYYYLLCMDFDTNEEYIAIHKASDNKLVAIMENSAEIRVVTSAAENTD